MRWEILTVDIVFNRRFITYEAGSMTC